MFSNLGCEIAKSRDSLAMRYELSRFVNHFGAKPKAIAAAWCLLHKDSKLRNGFKRKHLLMAMCYLKRNISENLAHSLFDVDEKTYREWRNCVVEKLLKSSVVSVTL